MQHFLILLDRVTKSTSFVLNSQGFKKSAEPESHLTGLLNSAIEITINEASLNSSANRKLAGTHWLSVLLAISRFEHVYKRCNGTSMVLTLKLARYTLCRTCVHSSSLASGLLEAPGK